MPRGLPVGKPAPNSVMTAPGVIRPTALFDSSVNQRFPSGPGAMPQRLTPDVSPVSNSEIEGPSFVVASAELGKRTAAQSAIAMVARVRTDPVSARSSGT